MVGLPPSDSRACVAIYGDKASPQGCLAARGDRYRGSGCGDADRYGRFSVAYRRAGFSGNVSHLPFRAHLRFARTARRICKRTRHRCRSSARSSAAERPGAGASRRLSARASAQLNQSPRPVRFLRVFSHGPRRVSPFLTILRATAKMLHRAAAHAPDLRRLRRRYFVMVQ